MCRFVGFLIPHVTFSSSSPLPLPAAFLTQTICLDDTTVKFEIWDTAGQERYHSLAPMYYRGAQAAIVVYDITNMVSAALEKSGVGGEAWFSVRRLLECVGLEDGTTTQRWD